jgi:hypothetical protein
MQQALAADMRDNTTLHHVETAKPQQLLLHPDLALTLFII